jgi:hypothetical protein
MTRTLRVPDAAKVPLATVSVLKVPFAAGGGWA